MPLWTTRHLVAAVSVGVRVSVAGLSVGGPPGVAQPYVTLGERVLLWVAQRFDLARRLSDLQAARWGNDRYASAIVSPVLQVLETRQDDGPRFPVAHVPDDTAHCGYLTTKGRPGIRDPALEFAHDGPGKAVRVVAEIHACGQKWLLHHFMHDGAALIQINLYRVLAE